MKAVVIEKGQAQGREFPLLAKSKQFGHVVYFITPENGVVIVPR